MPVVLPIGCQEERFPRQAREKIAILIEVIFFLAGVLCGIVLEHYLFSLV